MDLKSGMLSLKDEKPFAKGGHRACYRHPDDPSLCVKVMTEDWRTTARRMKAPWIVRKLRPKWYFHDNLYEFRFLRGEEARLREVSREFIPRAHAILETDVGEGLIVDLVQDEDGSISMTLSEYLWKNGLTNECEAALNTMWEGVEKYRIFVQGRPDNLVIKQRADGSCRCIAIDGFGFPQLIPLSKWWKKEARRKLNRRKESQRRSIEKILEKRKDGEKVSEKGFLFSR